MPYQIIQISHNRFMVLNPLTMQVHAYSTTWNKAVKQVRFLHALDSKKKK